MAVQCGSVALLCLGETTVHELVSRSTKMKTVWEASMRSAWVQRGMTPIGREDGCRGNQVGRAVLDGLPAVQSHEARQADREICHPPRPEGFQVSWQRFNGPVAMNEALLSNSTDIVSGWRARPDHAAGQDAGPSLVGICALLSAVPDVNSANPDIKSTRMSPIATDRRLDNVSCRGLRCQGPRLRQGTSKLDPLRCRCRRRMRPSRS